ncbi:MAG: T9SS type A sorting domain-containing protein, partial [Ignavibacteriaceae bacterium]|nr:T9SS type A sorting domain-containing protein [Ignavibacteriaceae bacterium]
TDAGESWYIVIRTGLTDTIGLINRFFFINPTTGWAVTTRGGILKTTDAGENWFAQLNVGANNIFSGIYFVDSLYGWTAGARPYKTTDGGNNWVQQTNTSIWLSDDVYFNNYLKGWIISGNKIYYTTNSGNDWIQDPQIYTYSRNFETISNTHFIITGTNIYESVDTGIVWQNITSQVGSYFTALHAPKIYQAYGVGPLGYIVSYLDTSIIPVELINFSVEQIENKILLRWVTATETNNYGFEILRTTDLLYWEIIGFISGNGSTSSQSNYNFYDTEVIGERCYYKLRQIDYDGSYEFSEIITINISIDSYSLSQNYPNPANPSTAIIFSVSQKTDVKIELFSITGEKLRQILNEEKDRGIYKIDINLSNYASGIYFYKMTTKSGYTATKKITLTK